MLIAIYFFISYIFLTYLFLIVFLSKEEEKNKNQDNLMEDEIHYYYLVPCVNEESVIGRTIESILALDPKGVVLPIDDASTDSTYEIMQSFKSERCIPVKREFPNAQKGKGEALNYALHVCIQDVNKKGYSHEFVVVGIVDADGMLSSNTLEELNKEFKNKEVSAVQMRVKMYNHYKNSLQLSQDYEFFTVNNITQKARRKTSTVGLSGNGQFFRLSDVLFALGESPWGNALLDDYEMTLKIMMNGLKIHYVDKAYVYQESLSLVKRFIKQRSRWIQGNLDCLKYLKEVRKSEYLSNAQKFSIYYFLSQPILNLVADTSIFLLVIDTYIKISKFLSDYNDSAHEVIYFLIVSFFVSILLGFIFTIVYTHDLKVANEPKIKIRQKLLLPIIASYVYILLYFSIIIAYWRYFKKDNSWIKTQRNNEKSE